LNAKHGQVEGDVKTLGKSQSRTINANSGVGMFKLDACEVNHLKIVEYLT
jgi:hypothetical protein